MFLPKHSSVAAPFGGQWREGEAWTIEGQSLGICEER